MGDYTRSTTGVIKGDTRGLDYGSYVYTHPHIPLYTTIIRASGLTRSDIAAAALWPGAWDDGSNHRTEEVKKRWETTSSLRV